MSPISPSIWDCRLAVTARTIVCAAVAFNWVVAPLRGEDANDRSPSNSASNAGPPAVDRGMLGVSLTNQLDGVLVTALHLGGPAELAGLRVGDQILAVNGQPMRSDAELIASIGHFPPGARVELLIRRRGWTNHFIVTLGSRALVAQLPTSAQYAAPRGQHPRHFDFRGKGFVSEKRAMDIYDPYLRALNTNFGP
jgi:membrane-associated protease RseP (regulator of RpoE activity)